MCIKLEVLWKWDNEDPWKEAGPVGGVFLNSGTFSWWRAVDGKLWQTCTKSDLVLGSIVACIILNNKLFWRKRHFNKSTPEINEGVGSLWRDKWRWTETWLGWWTHHINVQMMCHGIVHLKSVLFYLTRGTPRNSIKMKNKIKEETF